MPDAQRSTPHHGHGRAINSEGTIHVAFVLILPPEEITAQPLRERYKVVRSLPNDHWLIHILLCLIARKFTAVAPDAWPIS